ncbi:hypothetical protein BGW37DRAFT_177313 [Umbelopsis sp. PMI_123]|nr:hypothetical protein BGW37DRAFT_177313 [Umbelopsis sp. PMI_123]
MSPIKIDKPYHTPKSPRKAETLASTSAPTKIVFRSTSSNDVKVTVSSNQHGTSLPKSPTPPAFLSKIGFGSNKDKQMQQDTTKRDLKNKPLVPTFQGVKAPTYIPLISFMPSQPTPHRNTSLKKKREHTSASKMATITSSPPNPKILGEQTADHLDPDDMLWQQNGIRMVLKADDKVQRGSQTVPQVYSESPPSQSDMHSSSPSGSSPATSVSPNISTVNPLITRLRVHARTNLGCIKYMTFSSIVSYSSDLFSKMRMYYEQKDYANAYTHGLQGMIIATNILPQHHDFRLEMGPPYYNYLNILEVRYFRSGAGYLRRAQYNFETSKDDTAAVQRHVEGYTKRD